MTAKLLIKFLPGMALLAAPFVATVDGVALVASDRLPEKWFGAVIAPAELLRMWYGQLARVRAVALPAGNGRLGVMIFGGTNEERLRLNEDTLRANVEKHRRSLHLETAAGARMSYGEITVARQFRPGEALNCEDESESQCVV